MQCDFCPNELRDNVMRVELFGTEFELCKSCSEKAEYHILEICDRCKSAGWVSCDWHVKDGIAHFIHTCEHCN